MRDFIIPLSWENECCDLDKKQPAFWTKSLMDIIANLTWPFSAVMHYAIFQTFLNIMCMIFLKFSVGYIYPISYF